jgi:multidrug efflux pump subunit AcrA (membrane-fusion protein)
VANVGEQRPNSDAKVFRVTLEVQERDDLLRPAMTTSNRIITEREKDVLHIPLECLFNQDDTITYVYKKSGLNTEKQEVMLGTTNRNEVVVLAGIEEGDVLYLNSVNGLGSKSVALLPEMNGKRQKQQQQEEQKEVVPEIKDGGDLDAVLKGLSQSEKP